MFNNVYDDNSAPWAKVSKVNKIELIFFIFIEQEKAPFKYSHVHLHHHLDTYILIYIILTYLLSVSFYIH